MPSFVSNFFRWVCSIVYRSGSAPPLTAADILPHLTPVSVAPPVSVALDDGPVSSFSCALFQVREDGSILKADDVGIYLYRKNQWVTAFERSPMSFTATHYWPVRDFAIPK